MAQLSHVGGRIQRARPMDWRPLETPATQVVLPLSRPSREARGDGLEESCAVAVVAATCDSARQYHRAVWPCRATNRLFNRPTCCLPAWASLQPPATAASATGLAHAPCPVMRASCLVVSVNLQRAQARTRTPAGTSVVTCLKGAPLLDT